MVQMQPLAQEVPKLLIAGIQEVIPEEGSL